MFDQLASGDLVSIAAAIRDGKASATEVMQGYLARIESGNPRHKAFARVCTERALARAAAADLLWKSGQFMGPLHGVPIGIKDLIDVEGVATELGSVSCAGRGAALRSATVVSRLEASGAIVIGKTNTVEFAFGGWGTNYSVGTPRNPWGAQRHGSPGGSSSGSGVAVAAGLVPAALGTDTGGSVRIPSAFCGLTGLRPTVGRVPVAGIHPVALTFDTVGPMARSARDVALLFSVMSGTDDTGAAGDNARPRLASLEDHMASESRSLQGLRVGLPDTSEMGALDPGVAQACEAALRILSDDGAQIGPISLPVPLVDGVVQSGTIIASEAVLSSGDLAADDKPGDPGARRRVLAGGGIAASAYVAAMRAMARDRETVPDLFESIDIIALPTLPITAKEIDELDEDDLSPSRFTRFASWMGLPAMSLPVGLDAQGLPIGLQLIAAPWREDLLLRSSIRLQALSKWHQLRPETQGMRTRR